MKRSGDPDRTAPTGAQAVQLPSDYPVKPGVLFDEHRGKEHGFEPAACGEPRRTDSRVHYERTAAGTETLTVSGRIKGVAVMISIPVPREEPTPQSVAGGETCD